MFSLNYSIFSPFLCFLQKNYGETNLNGNEVYKVAFNPLLPYLWTPIFLEMGHRGIEKASFPPHLDPTYQVIKVRYHSAAKGISSELNR